MLQNIVVGPPMVGATDLRSPPEKMAQEESLKGSGSDSTFSRTLESRMKSRSEEGTKESPMRESTVKEERPSVEARKPDKVDKPEGRSQRKAETRQQAIQEFMDSFESEFQIPPTRLVEAMANLDEAALTQPPEETVDAVVEQLGLDDEQADKARAMYASLLTKLQQAPLPAQQAPLVDASFKAAVTPQSMQARVVAAQDRQSSIQTTVDRLNQKFWATPRPPVDTSITMDPMAKLAVDEASFQDLDLANAGLEVSPQEPAPEFQIPQNVPKMPELPPHLQGQMKEALAPGMLAALAAKRAALAAEQSQQAASSIPVASPEATGDLMGEMSKVVMKNGDLSQAPNAQESQAVLGNLEKSFAQGDGQQEAFQQQGQQDFLNQASPQAKGKQDLSASQKVQLESLMSMEGMAPIKGMETFQLDAATSAAPVVGAGAANAMGPADNEAAVKQIMNQAQYLIRKGGGEVKVQMTPEGMGTIQLKVMMQDGKVNLHMSADTQEAKKTIESSLADLKTSLAAHKLSMDNVKIDVVTNVSTDTATQNQSQNQGDAQRDQARQFWNQFNENFGSQGRRELIHDMPNLKGYGRRRDPLQPIETENTVRTARVTEGKGKGLNLVA